MKLVWFPQWFCQNYAADGESFGSNCPYCPYGYQNGRLVFEGQETASNSLADPADVLAFFNANAGCLGRVVEISGGEPLLYPHLDAILLALADWRWAITSNTLHTKMIRRLNQGRALARCLCWTASYHPLSNQDERFRDNIRELRESGVGNIRITLVVSTHTIDRIEESLSFIQSMRPDGYQFHLNSHSDLSRNPQLRERIERVAPNIMQYAGHIPVGRICDRHGKLMALGADGTLYECVTKAYRNLDPICKVDGSVLLAALPRRVAMCRLPCFAVCDHVKHTSEAV